MADVINFKIYLRSSSNPMVDRMKKGETEIQKVGISRTKTAFYMK